MKQEPQRVELQYSQAMIDLEHRYQVIRTLLNLVAIILLGLVLWNQSRILNSNHSTIDQIQKTANESSSRDKCVEQLLLQDAASASPLDPSSIKFCKGLE